jgi:hypothetical protein
VARIETDPNYTTPTFSRATAATDIFKMGDVQALAAALSTHTHDGAGKGLLVAAMAPGSITSAMIADGAITTADIGDQQVTGAKILPATVDYPQLKIGSTAVIGSAVGATANPTTTSTTNVDMPDMTANISSIGQDLLIWFFAAVNANTTSAVASVQLNIDGTDVGPISQWTSPGTNHTVTLTICYRVAATGTPAGRTIKGRWNVTSGTLTALWTYRSLVVMEARR